MLSSPTFVVINACATLGNARKAEAVMRSLQSSSKIRPNTVMYNLVIKAWSNSMEEDKGEITESLLREMYKRHQQGEDVKPNTVSVTD